MSSDYDKAGIAIRDTIIDWNLSGQNNWGPVIPANNWGMKLKDWRPMLADIVRRFDSAITPRKVDPDETFPASRTKELSKLQRRLEKAIQ